MNVKDFARALACAIGLFSGPAIADTFTNVYVQPTLTRGGRLRSPEPPIIIPLR